MSKFKVRLSVISFLVVSAIGAGRARAQPPAELVSLVTAGSVSTAQEQQIGQWVEKALSDIRPGQDAAVPQFYADVVTLIPDNASNPFREALARQLSSRSQAFLTRADAPRSRALAFAIGSCGVSDAAGALLNMLGNNDAGTRFLAAQGLERLGGQFGSAANVIDRIRQAALAESSPLVKAALCRALRLPEQVGTVVPALAEVIDTQADDYRKNGLKGVDALLAAVTVLDQVQLSGAPPQSKPGTMHAVANLMNLAVIVYSEQDDLAPSMQSDLERIVDRCESVLNKLLGSDVPAQMPKLAEAMRAGGEDVRARMQTQLDGWLGSPSVAGVLNAAPWSLPAGGGFAPIAQIEQG